jgi:hypothetical protein
MPKVTFDFNRLSYRDYRHLSATSSAEDTFRLLALTVSAWDLEADPHDPASYEALGLVDLLAVVGQLRQALQGLMAGNSDGLSI